MQRCLVYLCYWSRFQQHFACLSQRIFSAMACPNGCETCTSSWREVERIRFRVGLDITAYREQAIPIVVSGCAEQLGWEAMNWTEERLMRAAGGAVLPLARFSNGAEESVTMVDAATAIREAMRGSNGYVKAWEYDAPSDAESDSERPSKRQRIAKLVDDIGGGPPFLSCILAESDDPLVHVISRLMRWIFVGGSGCGSSTHVDPLNSAAWLLLISGTKEWRACDVDCCHIRGEHISILFRSLQRR
mmetsp:Transcript_28313/g.64300  ORF Transcript_28313/g.64300 Transcript_28313/m.64300 type:complete len:246 (+) Transcript_28313:1838-2575(+)